MHFVRSVSHLLHMPLLLRVSGMRKLWVTLDICTASANFNKQEIYKSSKNQSTESTECRLGK